MAVYSRLQIALHWIVALLIGANFLLGDRMGEAYDAALRAGTVGGPAPHAILGVLAGILILWRMGIKLRSGPAPVVAGTTPGMERLIHLGHLALYLVALLVIVSGMLTWGGNIEAAAAPHEVLKTVLVVLIGGHVVMALYHQFWLKDGTLARMLRAR